MPPVNELMKGVNELMKKALLILAAGTAVLLTGCGGGSSSGDPAEKAVTSAINDMTQTKEGCFSCTFDGVKHDLILDLPGDTKDAPLVIMLHGYGGSAEDFRSTVHFEEKANPMGYAVAYVSGAPDPTDRTSANCWNSTEDPDGNKDTAFLVSLAEYLQKEYSLDKDRLYAAGFSNGAFMNHTLAAEAGGTFSACASVAGTMQESIWEKRGSSNNVSFLQITGAKDEVVPKNDDGTAKYTNKHGIEDVMSYWTDSNGAVFSGEYDLGKKSVLRKYENTGTGRQIWDVTVKDGRHGWYSQQLHGFDTGDLILEFFESVK